MSTAYSTIRTKFIARLNRRDCSPSLADGFLQDAIQRIQRIIKVPAGEKSVSVTVSAPTYLTAGYLAIPSDYLKLRDLTITNADGQSRQLTRLPIEKVLYEVDNGVQGTSRCYARRGGSWVLGPLPLAGDVIRVDYYSEFADTSEDADTSILLDIAPDAVVFGALSYACDHWSDKRGPGFEGRFVQIISDIQAQGDDDELTGAAVVAQGFTYPDDLI